MKLINTIFLVAAFCAAVSVVKAVPVDVTAAPYYALGNGYTDNFTAIQSAINDVGNNGGGTVYFPEGYFNVSSTLSVPSNVRLQGMGSNFNCQIRLTARDVPLFEIGDGRSNITFKDLTLVGLYRNVFPRNTTTELALLRAENTTGISLKAAGSGISGIVIENVRASQFTRGISATSSITNYDASISNVRIRNYASEGNEYSLYTNTRGAGGWDIQNMNVFPMYENQNGIFLQLSGQMSFLQLSCAGAGAGICAKLWGNGDTYFRNMHVEGPTSRLLRGIQLRRFIRQYGRKRFSADSGEQRGNRSVLP